ncbi:MAG: MurR/RpiR family transcriptional regulator [Pseudomonadota bacterium]
MKADGRAVPEPGRDAEAPGAEAATTVRHRIADAMERMTRSEKRAAHCLLADYPMIGLESIGAFAERARVSAATLQRLIAKLGFESYPAFRACLRAELAAVREGPLTMARWYDASAGAGAGDGAGDAPRLALKQSMMAAIETTIDGIEEAELEAVVGLIADRRRRVFLAGGTFTQTLAEHLHFHLRKMRANVTLLEQDMPRRSDALLELARRDILILFDIRRYQPDMRLTAAMAVERGATVILVTDQWMSDIAELAAHIFRCRVDAATPWDTIVGLVALVELIVASVDQTLWPSAKPRLEALDTLRDRTFIPDWGQARGEE